MSSANSNGVNVQLKKMGTDMDAVLLGNTDLTGRGLIDQYSGQYSVEGHLPYVAEWESYNLTRSNIGISGFGGTECEAIIKNVGARLNRIAIVITAPPICNTITNCTELGAALATDGAAGEVLSATIPAGSHASGSFQVNELVTFVDDGDGSGFSGRVSQVDLDDGVGTTDAVNQLVSITIIEGGSGYAAGNTYQLEGTTSGAQTLANVVVVVATNALTQFPATGGRIIIPQSSGGAHNKTDSFASIATTSKTSGNANMLQNCVALESLGRTGNAAGVITKTVTGITITDSNTSHKHVRAGGLATDDIAAHYCSGAPFYLVRSVRFDASGTEMPFVVTSATLFQYDAYWKSMQNTLPENATHTFKNDYLLKTNSMTDIEWTVIVPFPFCHEKRDAIPIMNSLEYKVRVVFNGWRDILVNSPNYNDNLSITSSASTTVADPTAATYASEIATYTVTGGRLGTTRTSMLSAASATTVVVPSTVLTDTMFQATLLVEHLRYAYKVEKQLKMMPVKRVVCLHRELGTTPLDGTHDGTRDFEFTATLPTSHLYIETQRRSRALLNKRMDFSAPEDPLHRQFAGSHLDSAVGSQGANTNHFFKKVKVFLESEQRMDIDPREGSNMALASIITQPHVQGTTGMLLAFTNNNPFDRQWGSTVSMTDISRKTLEITVNEAVLQDQQYIGGLPEDLFDARLYQYCFTQLEIDPVAGTMSCRYSN